MLLVRKLNATLFATLLLLVIWSLLVSVFSSSGNNDGLISSLRMLFEVTLALACYRATPIDYDKYVAFLIAIAFANSLVILFFVGLKFDFIIANINPWFMEDMFDLHHDPTRSMGILPSYQSSGLLSFLAVCLSCSLSNKYSKLILVIVFALFFSSRFWLVASLSVLIVSYWSFLFKRFNLFLTIALGALVIAALDCNSELLLYHYETRILSVFELILNPFAADWGFISSEWVVHQDYLLIGTGFSKYHALYGGGDTAFFRWLAYGGLFAALLIITIVVILSMAFNNVSGVAYHLVVSFYMLSIFKSDAVLSTGFVFLTVLILNYKNICAKNLK